MTGQIASHAQPRAFPQTRWSVVLAAKRETTAASAAALETICRAYWYPLDAYVVTQTTPAPTGRYCPLRIGRQ